jgi:EAL domain-containing protein (putative c-di-GMP-specific phosphodiesterase class I)
LAKALKLSLIAEGVETEAEWAHLVRLGCHLIQGFLVSRPVDAKSALALLHQGIQPGALPR